MKVNYIYNNEAIASLALSSFLKVHKTIEFEAAALVLAFLLHEPTVKKLNSSAYKRSIDEFIVQYPDLLVGFNARYLGFFPLYINAVTILSEGEVVKLGKGIIVYNSNSNFNPVKSGNRYDRIAKAVEPLSQIIIQENTTSLYLKLKVQL